MYHSEQRYVKKDFDMINVKSHANTWIDWERGSFTDDVVDSFLCKKKKWQS